VATGIPCVRGCGCLTDRMVDDGEGGKEALCVWCEDEVPCEAAKQIAAQPVRKLPHAPTKLTIRVKKERKPNAAKVEQKEPEDKSMKLRKAEAGEPACACGNLLWSDNKTGVCKECRKKTGKRTSKTSPKKLPAKPQSQDLVPIYLSEAAMDDFWQQASVESKAEMITAFLARVHPAT
jgi:hypothetical protein